MMLQALMELWNWTFILHKILFYAHVIIRTVGLLESGDTMI